MPTFQAAKAFGATTGEIDVVLTAEAEPIIVHDLTVDRATDGHGFAADLTLDHVRTLDAGASFDPRFAGTKAPTLAERLIATLSGDDVPFLARLVARAGRSGRAEGGAGLGRGSRP